MSRLDYINLENKVQALEDKLNALIKQLTENAGPPTPSGTLTLNKKKAA